MRYWACGRDADSLDGQKNIRDADNARKAAPYPQVQCTLCWLAGGEATMNQRNLIYLLIGVKHNISFPLEKISLLSAAIMSR